MTGQAPADKTVGREAYYACLMAHACGQGNDDALARIYASWVTGAGALPEGWGLSSADYAALMSHHFPGYARMACRDTADQTSHLRSDEVADLENLLVGHRAGVSPSERWMASIVATACLASDHLWQDLGLWCRDDLSRLMQRNFPALAEKNIRNMKWKKFLYKQLCGAEGVYVCRSPSCEVCADYQNCFGPED
jgi:nitrogen fixation protein NifQ